MLKAYKYRIYPNNEQKIQIAKTFGCCRFVYNQTLAYRKEVYEKEKKSVSKTDCNNYCNRQLKKEYEWLKEVDKFALTNAIYNMDAAYQKFFKEHAGYPKFKSKHDNHKSYTTNFTNGNIAVDFEGNRVKLPKLKNVKAKLHRNFSGQIKSATILQIPSGKYYVSILVETEHVELPHVNQNTGIDLGIKELWVNALCCDQYLAIILPGRMFKEAFEDRRLAPKNLSRCLEDSGTITSNFFPWNTCGATMRSFLQVGSGYIPYAVLNWINPLISIFYGFTGITMTEMTEEEYQKILEEREREKEEALKALEA